MAGKSRRRVFGAAGALGLVLLAAAAFGADDSTAALPAVGYARLALGTLAAVGLVLLSARFLPRLAGVHAVARDGLRVIASLPVGQRERVVLVQIGDEQVLLGVAPGRVELIQKLAVPLMPRGSARAAAPPGWMERVLGRGA